MKEKKKQLIVVALAFALLLLIGGTYAYFSINATSDKTGAKVAGKANNLGNPTMQIKTSKLYLNLDANLMSQANAGKTYYANENESGLALETNPNYTLATAQLPEGDEALDCTYNYKVTATVTTPITDNSDSDVKVVVGDKTMTLKELTTAGTNGIIVSGEIKNLTKGNSVSIPLSSSVTNTATTQDKLVGNSYTIKIEPYNSGDKKAFSCKLRYKIDTTKTFAQNLIDSGWLWQSNLEGDGYRYTGSGAVGTDTNPNNFICFGTTDKSECTANQDKYMYRVLGVFSDTNGDNHVKLIKYKSLGKYSWTSDYSVDDSWINSDLYHRLNGLCGNDSCKDKDGNVINNIFVGNNDYIIENNEWDSLIKPWKYSIVNTNSNANKAVNYFNGMSMKEIYLHELNRNTGTIKGGTFQTLQFKIGLMYASDYSLSLGNSSLQMTGGSYTNRELLKNSWINLNNNDSNNLSEWLLTEYGMDEEISNIGGPPYCNAWFIQGTTGAIGGYHTVANLKQRFNGNVISWMDVRPVFYLNSEVAITKGIGTINNPYIVKVPSIS